MDVDRLAVLAGQVRDAPAAQWERATAREAAEA